MAANRVTKLIVSRLPAMVRRDDVLMVESRRSSKEMNGAYRVPGADEVLNTDLQTCRVFRLLLFLRSRHLEYSRYPSSRAYLADGGRRLFTNGSGCWELGSGVAVGGDLWLKTVTGSA